MASRHNPQSTIYVQIIILCFLCIFTASAQRSRKRSVQIDPQDTEVPNGKVVTLRCVFDSPANDCYWTRDDHVINETLLQFTGNRLEGDCSIQFDAQNTTSGRWQCGLPMTETLQGILSQSANVKVSGLVGQPGRLDTTLTLNDADRFVTEPSNTTVRSGDNVVLKCVFKLSSNRNTEHCYWENNGNVIDIAGRYAFVSDRASGDCSLSITAANHRMDNGAWLCGIPQTQGSKGIKSREAYLTLAVAPKEPKILKDGVEVPSGSELGVEFNKELDVTCQSESGNPPADLQWTRNGLELPGTNEVVPTMNLWTRRNQLRQTMTDDWRDQQLRCTANHPSYDDGQQHFAFVIIKPFQLTQRADIICRNSNDPQRTVTLQPDDKADFECRADGNPKPEYRWQTRAVGQQQWQKLIDNVQNLTVTGSSSQDVRCMASNDKFQSFAYSEHWTIVAASDSSSVKGIQLVAVPLMIVCTMTSLKIWFE